MSSDDEAQWCAPGGRQALRLPAAAAQRLAHLFRHQPDGHPLQPLLRLYRSRPERILPPADGHGGGR